MVREHFNFVCLYWISIENPSSFLQQLLKFWAFWVWSWSREVIGCQEFNCVCKSAPGGRHKETPFYQQQQSLLAHKLIGFLGHQHSKDGNSSSSSSKTNCLLKGLKWNNYSYTCSHIRKLLLYKKEGAQSFPSLMADLWHRQDDTYLNRVSISTWCLHWKYFLEFKWEE